MKIESVSGTRKAICKSAGPFQRTFVTPRQRLPAIAEVLLRARLSEALIGDGVKEVAGFTRKL